MPSDKKDTNAKHASGTAKSSLKQSTLLESFTTRPSSSKLKIPYVEMTVDRADATCNNLQPQELQDASTSKADSLDISILTEQDSTAHFLDLGSYPDIPLSIANPNSHRRSPSILVVDSVSRINPVMTGNDFPEIRQTPRPEKADGSTKDQPIIIDLSSPHSVARQNGAVPSDVASPIDVGKKVALTRSTHPVPYPPPIPLHIRGPQTAFSSPSLSLPRSNFRNMSKESDETRGYQFLKLATSCQTEDRFSQRVRFAPIDDNSVTIIPDEIKAAHPVIAHFVDLKPWDKPFSHRPWTDKWRPSCAQEVLGNESRAVYLRDWLRALELQLGDKNIPPIPTPSLQDGRDKKGKAKTVTRGTKRPRVVRMVDKTRRKRSRLDSDEEDDWIVYTDDEGEDTEVVSDQLDESDEVTVNDQAGTSMHSTNLEPLQRTLVQTDERISDLDQLYNTILLAGPSGCGKTASVYACAEELGWDVFEVYPGIGRRNASNIDNLIGEVGKNHLVLKTRGGDPLKTLLRAKQKTSSDETVFNALSQISPRKSGSIGISEAESPRGPYTKSVRQSLILLEEVDILFKEDTNFWSTVTKIIEECKRPVICTCNDISLVPVQNLPLQSILLFRPCPGKAAAYYLRALCAAEGYHVDWKDIARLYSDPLGRMAPDEYGCPPTPDLRATINALQLNSSGATAPPGEQTEETGGKDCASLERLSVRRVDFFSVLDAYVEQDLSSKYALADLCNHVPSEDDETGHVVLCDIEDNVCLELCDRQSEMISTANELAQEVFKVDIGQSIRGGEEERIRQEQRVVAGELCPVGVNEASVSVEYIPFARQILEAEDRLEEEMRPRSGRRKTRNSGRSEYVRMLEVTVACRELISAVLAWA